MITAMNDRINDERMMLNDHHVHDDMPNERRSEFTRQKNTDQIGFDPPARRQKQTVRQQSLDDQEESGDGDDNIVGELTGEVFDLNIMSYERGMPMRSFQDENTKKRIEHDQSHLDFDLFTDKVKNKNKNKKILYNSDSGDGVYSNLEEAMTPIINESNSYESCIVGVNSSCFWLNSNIAKSHPMSYGVSGYAMFSIMGVMYLLGDGDISEEYISFFEFQNKKKLNAGLVTLREKLVRFRNQIIIDNYLIASKDVEIDAKIADNLMKLANTVIVDPLKSRIDVQKLNAIVKKLSNARDIFSAATISNIESLSLVSINKIRPIFAIKIDKVLPGVFFAKNAAAKNMSNSIVKVKCEYIRFLDAKCGIYEDRTIRVLEIPLDGGDHVFGIVMNKDASTDYGNAKTIFNVDSRSNIDFKRFITYQSYLDVRNIDEILLPKISRRFKIRLNNTLKNAGLEKIFTTRNYSILFPTGTEITDCIQYTDLVIGEYYSMSSKTEREVSARSNSPSGSKFHVKSEFEYYIRDITTNTMLFMGKYNG